MAVRKTTTTTVTGPREYALSKGKVVGTTQSRITITRSAPDYRKAIDLLRLPVFMLLFWLLVMAPFFTIMTTVSDGKIILADDFQLLTVNDSDLTLYTYTFENGGYLFASGNSYTDINGQFRKSYYDIMENARTAQYGNPFEFVNFLLQLPNMVGNSKPLAFLGIDASFSDMNQQVLEIRASGYQGLLDLFKVLNPVRWFE
jgi:hypothetical protein